MSKYKAIGFDYGGVIFGEPGQILMQKIRDHLGVTQDDFKKAWWQHNHKMNKGNVSYEDVWKMVLHDLGKDQLFDDVMKMQKLDSETQYINQNILNLSDALRQKGYKTGILSNMSKSGAEEIIKKGIEKHFDIMDFSCNIGAMKPEPEAFQKLIDDLGVEMKELVFIDDNEKPLETADALGFKPILFENFDQLKIELTKLGIDSG